MTVTDASLTTLLTDRSRPDSAREHAHDVALPVSERIGAGGAIICSLRIGPDSACVAQVRQQVCDDLLARGREEQLVDEARVVVSELVANAIRHARPLGDGTIRVRWKMRPDTVEVEVTDGGSPSVPHVVPRTVWGEAGRGLRVVRTIAHEWGVTQDRTGHVVWATLGGPSRRRVN